MKTPQCYIKPVSSIARGLSVTAAGHEFLRTGRLPGEPRAKMVPVNWEVGRIMPTEVL